MSEHAEPATPRRAIWLIGVPVLSAVLPWLLLSAADKSPSGLVLLLVGVLPLVGGLGALSFAFVAPVRMPPLVPYVAAGALFLFFLLVGVNMTSGGGLDFGPVKAVAIILPVLALAGGLVSYAWLPEPEAPWESEQEAESDDEANPVG